MAATIHHALVLFLVLLATPSAAFQQQQRITTTIQSAFTPAPTTAKAKATAKATAKTTARTFLNRGHSARRFASNNNDDAPEQQPYVRMSETPSTATKTKALLPNIGDVVRYYDLDGGQSNGQVLVGKISFVFGSASATSGYSVELNELEDVGDGYFAEYSSALRSRKGRKTERRLTEISPIAASFVGSEQAYKVPLDRDTGLPKPRQETYDLDRYKGPAFYMQQVNNEVVAQDAENYSELKSKLFRNVALTGLVGTIVGNACYGTEQALIYFAGSLASLLYLFLLSLKTDTVAINKEDNTQNLAGTPIANLRFGAPVLVLIGVSVWNSQKMSSGLGGADNALDMQPFDTVTGDQFGAAILGFLTYRVPLFVGQLRDAFQKMEAEDGNGDIDNDEVNSAGGIQLPGSAGVAAKLLGRGKITGNDDSGVAVAADDLVTVLLISGPKATGRSELVRRLLEDSAASIDNINNRVLVPPNRIWKRDDGATFERLEQRGDFLDVTHESGLTAEGITNAAGGVITTTTSDGGTAQKEIPNKNVVVVDASVELAKKLATSTNLPGNTRLISVWVGLQSVKDFQTRLEADIEAGTLVVPSDETRESFLRARIKDIVNEIDFGLGAGIFEFTILNDANDPDKSLKELKDAASYAFK